MKIQYLFLVIPIFCSTLPATAAEPQEQSMLPGLWSTISQIQADLRPPLTILSQNGKSVNFMRGVSKSGRLEKVSDQVFIGERLVRDQTGSCFKIETSIGMGHISGPGIEADLPSLDTKVTPISCPSAAS